MSLYIIYIQQILTIVVSSWAILKFSIFSCAIVTVNRRNPSGKVGYRVNNVLLALPLRVAIAEFDFHNCKVHKVHEVFPGHGVSSLTHAEGPTLLKKEKLILNLLLTHCINLPLFQKLAFSYKRLSIFDFIV